MRSASKQTGTGWTKNTAEPGPVSPLIARALRDEIYYGDGPPTWPKARSSKNAKRIRKRYAKRLRRFARQFSEAKALAKLLARCKPGQRCMSGACQECGRAFQRYFVSELKTLADNTDGEDLHSVSIIFQKSRTPDDHLGDFDTIGMKRSMSETIKHTDDLAWMAGGIDLSLNDGTQKNEGIAWRPQLYAIAETDASSLSKTLRARFSSTKTTRRPVQIKECDGTEAAISYAFKTDFVRRIAYQKEVGPPDRRRKCWHTRKVSLRAGEHVQAMLWMHKIGLAGRLFLRGVRTTRTGNSVGLVKIKKLE
jgi:hypothetical protein